MKNEISHRKTPHALRTRMTFDGVEKFIETRWAWAFEVDGDFTSPLIWKEVKLTHCFVKSKKQEIADKQLRSKDMRSWTVDVHLQDNKIYESMEFGRLIGKCKKLKNLKISKILH